MRGPLLYRALLPLARPLVRVFHRTITVEHRERVPRHGPLIFAANHPNMMLDVLLLGTSQPRPLHFLAKATLFDNVVLHRLLRSAGVLPVYRRRDRPDETGKNVVTFEACYELLARGGAIALFPEGLSHERLAVLPLKTGCARILLEAEARYGFQLGALVVPVGIAFSDRELFRSDARIVFGEPIDPSPHFDTYHSGDAGAAVKELTREIEQRLRELAPHVPRQEDETLVSALREFYSDPDSPLTERFEVDRRLVDAIHYFRERNPVRYSRLRRRLLRYRRALEGLGLLHHQVERRYRLGPVLRYLSPRLLLALAGFLPFLYGTLNNFLPYKIPAWIARWRSTHVVERASTKFFAGLVAFPIFYVVQTWIVGLRLGGLPALAYFLLLPSSGLAALVYLETLGGFFEEIRLFFFHWRQGARLRHLKRWRGELLQEFEEFRRDYESLHAPGGA